MSDDFQKSLEKIKEKKSSSMSPLVSARGNIVPPFEKEQPFLAVLRNIMSGFSLTEICADKRFPRMEEILREKNSSAENKKLWKAAREARAEIILETRLESALCADNLSLSDSILRDIQITDDSSLNPALKVEHSGGEIIATVDLNNLKDLTQEQKAAVAQQARAALGIKNED